MYIYIYTLYRLDGVIILATYTCFTAALAADAAPRTPTPPDPAPCGNCLGSAASAKLDEYILDRSWGWPSAISRTCTRKSYPRDLNEVLYTSVVVSARLFKATPQVENLAADAAPAN